MSTTNGNGLPPGLHRGQQHLSHPTLPIGGGKYVATAADGKQVLNRAFIDALATLTDNAMTARREWLTKLGDPRRDIDDECGYAKELTVSDFKNMYDREPVAGRVVEAIVKESWALPPTVYEDENEENVTAFEQAWDDLGKSISAAGGTSWHQDEEGSPVWEYLKRADTLSRIGRFGILFIGFDDGLDLSEPVPGSVEEEGSDTPGVEAQKASPEPTKRVGLKPAKPDKPVTNAELEMLRKLPNLSEGETAVINRLEGEAQAVHNRISTPKELVDSGRDPYLWPTSGIGADAQYFGQYGGRSDTVATKPAKQERKVLFLRAFGEDLVQIVRYEWNPTNPRFGQPVMYRVTFNDPNDGGLGQPLSTLFVHWSRVIHIADVEHHARSSEIFAAEAMRPVWNRLWNIRKTSGAAGEGYWRAGVPGLIVKTPANMGGERPIIDGGEQSLKDDMEQFQNGFQRVLYLANLEAQTLTPSSVDPTPFIDADLTAIAMKLGMPKRVLMGSERGELASSQDDASWNDRVHARRTTYNQPRIIVPFIDRLILVGVLPEPDFVAPVEAVPGDALKSALPPAEAETKAKEADAKAAGAPTDGAGGPAPTPGKLPSKSPVPTPKKGGPPVANYDASQPRDEKGQWAAGLKAGVFAFQSKKLGGLMTEITLKDEDGKTAGLITIRPRLALDGGGNEIHEVGTMSGFKRKGVATELYRRAYLVSKAAGKSLHTSQVISDDAKALHKSFREKGYLNGTELTFNGLVTNAAPPVQALPPSPPGKVEAKGSPIPAKDKEGAEPGDAAGQVGGEADGATTQTKPVGYRIYWPDLDSTTDTDKANIAGTLTTAMAAYVSGGLDALIPPLDYLTKVCGFDAVEAKMMLAVAEAAAQQAQAEAQALADEHGLVPEIDGFRDPSEPPPVGPGGMVFEGDPRAKEKPTANQLEDDEEDEDEEVENQFCPTGEGGGVDPGCSPSERAKAVLSEAAKIRLTDSLNPKDGEWGKDEDRRGRLIDSYTVKTAGGKYTATVGAPGGLGRNVEFRDQGGSMEVTGAGGAADTFTKINTAMVAVVKGRNYDVLTFSAAEPSRQRLYSRLVSSLSRLVPEYAAVSAMDGGSRRYVLVKRDKLAEMTERLKDNLDAEVTVHNTATDPDPFDFSDAAVTNQFCPTGEGGGIDPTCGAGGGAATGDGGTTGNPKSDNALGSAPGKDLKAGGGVRLVEHEGKQLVVKQRPNVGEVGPNEVMTSELARKAGVTMPAARMTTINGKPAQVQEFKEGTELAKMSKEEQRAAVRKVPKDQVDKNTMFDYLMGSSDTHNGNYLVDGKGNMVAIDKEFTLSKGEKGQKFHPPQFLNSASADGNGLNYRFDPKTIQTMVGKGEDIAKDLDVRGMKAEARQVRDRVAVLNQLANDPNPTAGRLWSLGSQGVTPPGLGALGKLRWHLTKNSAEGDDNGQP